MTELRPTFSSRSRVFNVAGGGAAAPDESVQEGEWYGTTIWCSQVVFSAAAGDSFLVWTSSYDAFAPPYVWADDGVNYSVEHAGADIWRVVVTSVGGVYHRILIGGNLIHRTKASIIGGNLPSDPGYSPPS